MPLQATLDSLEGLPEEFHEDYEQRDGKFHLKILDGFVAKDQVEDVTGLKSALEKEREAARKAAARARALEEKVGEVDPEDYARLKELEAKQEEDKAKKAGEWDKLRDQMTTKHNEELNKRTAREQALIKALESKTVDAEAVSAINDLEGNVTLLLPHVKGHVKMVEEDGEFVARVVDDKGDPRVNGEGKFLTVRELVSEMRDQETYANAFKSQSASGGGTPPGGGGQGGGGKPRGIPGDLKRSSMSTKEKVAFIKEHGEAKFMDLPA